MNSEAADTTSVYKIGVVSRLTGISAETLRIWERRYDTVTPARTAAGDRVYDADDIARLRLIKQLVDHGDSIGSVASLTEQVLQARINDFNCTANDPFRDSSHCHTLIYCKLLYYRHQSPISVESLRFYF